MEKSTIAVSLTLVLYILKNKKFPQSVPEVFNMEQLKELFVGLLF